MSFRIFGFGFRVWGFFWGPMIGRAKAEGSGFRVWSLRCREGKATQERSTCSFRVRGVGLVMAQGLGFRV